MEGGSEDLENERRHLVARLIHAVHDERQTLERMGHSGGALGVVGLALLPNVVDVRTLRLAQLESQPLISCLPHLAPPCGTYTTNGKSTRHEALGRRQGERRQGGGTDDVCAL